MSINCCVRFQHMNVFGKAFWVLFLVLVLSAFWYFGLPILRGDVGYVLIWFAPYIIGGVLFGLLLFGLALGVLKLLEWIRR